MADSSDIPDPLEELQRARGQYTQSRATQTLSDYSWQAPRHAPAQQTVRHIPFPYPEGGPSSGDGGFGGGEAQVWGKDRATPQWNPEWDKPHGHAEHDEGGTAGDTTTGNAPPGGDYSPWGSHQPDFNDQPVPRVQGSSVGEPVTSEASPYL
jgi:hypothetical protein